MDVARNLVRREFHHARQSQLREQFCYFGTDHGCAEKFAIFFIHNNFYKAAVIAHSERLAICLKWETPDLDSESAFLGLRFCHAE